MILRKGEFEYAAKLAEKWPDATSGELREAINLWTGGEASSTQLDRLTDYAERRQKRNAGRTLDQLNELAALACNLAMIVQTQTKAPASVKHMAWRIIELGNDLKIPTESGKEKRQ